MCNPSCGSGEFCNSEFKCESTDCKTSCPNGDGSYSSTYKSCTCGDDPQTAAAACDSTCQSAASVFSYDSGNSKYSCYWP